MTNYLVLTQDDSGYWSEVDTVDAVSADAAVRRVFAVGSPNADGRLFVAIPVRSWKPRKVTIEATPRLKLS